MPSSAKFLKEVLSNKRKWEGGETVKLNEECSTILQNKLPPKLKDPWSFSFPYTIGNNDFDKSLCDLAPIAKNDISTATPLPRMTSSPADWPLLESRPSSTI
ncbi:hypothetical protein Sango_2803400 [Sesamum angolense]|uniref:Uncharacterized protein n=1 Tax=Sesamum angolense TaxID=2727404 RepID=A0AAE1W0M2_9LAMI|nr:hypothetical protein Sango_2803400 [Sesamum angolense]